MRRLLPAWMLSIPMLIVLLSMAQVARSLDTIISLETEKTALVMQVDAQKHLHYIYQGVKLDNRSDYNALPAAVRSGTDYTGMYNSVYTSSGSRNLLEPAITVTHADGNQSLDLQYVSHTSTKISPDIELLKILLKDPVYPVEVTLYYKVYHKENVIEQWSVIVHHEKDDIILQKFASANLYLKADSYWLRQYHGDWAKEMQPEETQLTHGIKTLDSKLGTRANLFMPSVFMVSLNKPADEDEGDVLLGAL